MFVLISVRGRRGTRLRKGRRKGGMKRRPEWDSRKRLSVVINLVHVLLCAQDVLGLYLIPEADLLSHSLLCFLELLLSNVILPCSRV
jgi:hypothetical protein